MDVSPHGRFVVVGGYGNLAGGMDFWDRNKEKKIPRYIVKDGWYVTVKDPGDLTVTSSSPVVGHEWAPDSRTYLVSTTSPRMNVENGVNLYRYDGSLVEEKKLPWENAKYRPDKLLSAEYVPAPLVNDEFFYYPDRPQSPPPRGLEELKGEAASEALASIRQSAADSNNSKTPAAAAYVPPAARGGAYVPPGARRGPGGGTSLAERMRQEREGSAAAVTGKKVVKRSGPVGASSVGPVGSAPADPDAKSKNAIRREKQRLAKEKAEREAAEAEQRKKDEEAARAKMNKEDPEKRAKKIKKVSGVCHHRLCCCIWRLV
jgi:translation initiation factor 2A